jgi:hypothetical protein
MLEICDTHPLGKLRCNIKPGLETVSASGTYRAGHNTARQDINAKGMTVEQTHAHQRVGVCGFDLHRVITSVSGGRLDKPFEPF